MKPTEAYNFVIDKVQSLVQHGIKVKIEKYDKDLAKPESTDYLPVELWSRVQLKYFKQDQLDLIYDTLGEINAAGIRFDTGRMGNVIDWEIDWSFGYSEKE